jgi:hypothetical protein
VSDKDVKERLPHGMHPRLLNKDQAAAYCGVSEDTFEKKSGVKPLPAFGSRVLYDRKAIDHWLDQLSGLISEPPKSFSDRLRG